MNMTPARDPKQIKESCRRSRNHVPVLMEEDSFVKKIHRAGIIVGTMKKKSWRNHERVIIEAHVGPCWHMLAHVDPC